ncbi:HAD hydrolase-like protein [Phycisphaeraceae bacterium D3-23]
MARSLLLFDIDGTLMITKGAGSRCLHRAGRRVFGESFEWTDITVGTLDPQIFAQLAQHNGIGDSGEHLERFRDTYLAELEAELGRIGDDITRMPGIPALLDTLHARTGDDGDLTLGLLTGNFIRAAHLKLNAAGFDLARFPVTAFAEDGSERNDLPRIAMERARAHTGEAVDPGRVYIIGDTPRDVACAHANGCVAVAVATGRYSVEQLHEAGGDLVLDSLADPEPLLDLLQAR